MPYLCVCRSPSILMAGSPTFSFVIDGAGGPPACTPYSPGDEYWSSGDGRLGYHDSEERIEFYVQHGSSMPANYDCVFQFEEVMDQHLAEAKREKYDLLVMKYKRISGLYGDLCVVGRTALNRLCDYDGLLGDLPAFINDVLQSLLWSMMDLQAMFGAWEGMKTASERAPIESFNAIHRRMDQLELMTMSCPHEAESAIPRRYRKYFEMQNTTLSALIHPVYTVYLDDFRMLREIGDALRDPLSTFEEVKGRLETHISGMEARLARFPIFNGMVHPL